jgi:hypothetical protein
MKTISWGICIIIILVCTGNTAAQEKSKNARSVKIAEIAVNINLNEADIELFKKTTRQKVDEFQEHILIISNKDESRERRNLAEKEALKLFLADATMEISQLDENGNITIVARPMGEYLYRLKVLPYTKVLIEFYDIAYVSNFTKGTDGRFYATATVFQKFTGFTGDEIVYSDITKKEIEIIVDLVEDEFYNQKHWKIFLGDIRATETKSIELATNY